MVSLGGLLHLPPPSTRTKCLAFSSTFPSHKVSPSPVSVDSAWNINYVSKGTKKWSKYEIRWNPFVYKVGDKMAMNTTK